MSITSIVLFPDPTQKTQTLRMYRCLCQILWLTDRPCVAAEPAELRKKNTKKSPNGSVSANELKTWVADCRKLSPPPPSLFLVVGSSCNCEKF